MNIWLIVLLIVVVGIFFILSAVEKRKKEADNRPVSTSRMSSPNDIVENPFKRKENKQYAKIHLHEDVKPTEESKSGGRIFAEDVKNFFDHAWEAIIHLFFVFVHIAKYIFGVLKEFWKWFRADDKKDISKGRQDSSRKRS